MKMLVRRTEGQIILVVAISLVVLLALVGLALDIGIAYGVKAKLNAAVDAAALAACKVKASGADDATSFAAAANLFHANFPKGYLGVKTVSEPNTSTSTVNGGWNVTVTASAESPAYFARVLGWKYFTVNALAEASKPSLDMSLVIDTTASMNSVFSKVKNRAEEFVDRFNEKTDRVALVPFATSVGEDGAGKLTDGVEINIASAGFSKDAVKGAINKLHTGGNTASEVGMRVALDQLNKVNAPAGRRVIVFFSDGAPNTFTGVFPLTTGGTADGNLFSETWNSHPPPRPHTLFDSNYTYKNKKDLGNTLKSIPVNGGGNIMGGKTVPLVPVTGKRFLNGNCNGNTACLKCDANKAARNMLENIAAIARKQGIVIYSLGLGNLLDEPDINDEDCHETHEEKGSTIMKRIANTRDSDTYDSLEPTGLYCHAETIDDLGPCFDAISKAILHLSK
ncbi:MAG: VWA domain-containing protein [Geobacteraceae bacterium]